MEQKNEKDEYMLAKFEEAYSNLSFSDDFIFGKVMQDKRLSIPLLKLLTGNDINDVENIEVQKQIKITYDSKGTRYDVYLEDNNNRMYDSEMQQRASRKGKLPKRIRFYQGMMDLNELENGCSYEKLKESYVIFICRFDPFNKNKCMYSFENLCREDSNLSLGDGRKIFLFNTKGDRNDAPQELADFLDYIETGTVKDKFTGQIDNAVKMAKMNHEWKVEFMKELLRYQDARDDGFEDGFENGFEDGFENGMKKGESLGRIKILYALVQENVITLDKAAENAEMTVDEFEKMINEIFS